MEPFEILQANPSRFIIIDFFYTTYGLQKFTSYGTDHYHIAVERASLQSSGASGFMCVVCVIHEGMYHPLMIFCKGKIISDGYSFIPDELSSRNQSADIMRLAWNKSALYINSGKVGSAFSKMARQLGASITYTGKK